MDSRQLSTIPNPRGTVACPQVPIPGCKTVMWGPLPDSSQETLYGLFRPRIAEKENHSQSSFSNVIEDDVVLLLFPGAKVLRMHRTLFEGKSTRITEWIANNRHTETFPASHIPYEDMKVILGWAYRGNLEYLTERAKLPEDQQIPFVDPHLHKINGRSQEKLYEMIESVMRSQEGKDFKNIPFPDPHDRRKYYDSDISHVDLGMIASNLLDFKKPIYQTFAQFKDDVDRMYKNLLSTLGQEHELTEHAGVIRSMIFARLYDEFPSLKRKPKLQIDNDLYAQIIIDVYKVTIDYEIPGLSNLLMTTLAGHHFETRTFPSTEQFINAYQEGDLPKDCQLHKYLAKCYVYGYIFQVERVNGLTNEALEERCVQIPGLGRDIFAALRGTNGYNMTDPRIPWPCDYHTHEEGEWCEVSKKYV